MVAAGDGQSWAGSDLSSPTRERPIDLKENLWGELENQARIFMQIISCYLMPIYNKSRT